MSKFVIKKRSNNEFQFNLKSPNGEVILSSEGYTQKVSCTNGIDSVRKNSQDDNLYERKISTNGKHFFNLKALNGQVIGSSELYESTTSRENGISSVKTNAPAAVIEDQTA